MMSTAPVSALGSSRPAEGPQNKTTPHNMDTCRSIVELRTISVVSPPFLSVSPVRRLALSRYFLGKGYVGFFGAPSGAPLRRFTGESGPAEVVCPKCARGVVLCCVSPGQCVPRSMYLQAHDLGSGCDRNTCSIRRRKQHDACARAGIRVHTGRGVLYYYLVQRLLVEFREKGEHLVWRAIHKRNQEFPSTPATLTNP